MYEDGIDTANQWYNHLFHQTDVLVRGDEAKTTGEYVSDEAERMYNDASTKTEETYENTKDTFKETYDSILLKTQGMFNNLQAKFTGKTTPKTTYEQAIDEVDKAYKNTKDGFAKIYDDVSATIKPEDTYAQKVEKKYQKAKDAAKEKYNAAVGNKDTYYERTKESLADSYNEAVKELDNQYKQLKESLKRKYNEDKEKYYNANP